MKTKSILVTGHTGFIGGNFVKKFREMFPKILVVGVDIVADDNEEIEENFLSYKASINDKVLMEKIFLKHKPEFVFHFAALPRVAYTVEHPTESSMTNVLGTIALLEMAHIHGVKRLIFSSSSAVYGNAKKLPTKESDNIRPQSPYALQKYAGENFCKLFSELYGLDTVCLRYFNVYGPGQLGTSPYATVVAAWLEGLYFPSQKTPFLEGDGKQSRDLCYVDDVVMANILAMQSKKDFSGEAFNIASSKKVSLIEIKTLIEKLTKKKLVLEKRKPRVGDVRHTQADIQKTKTKLKFKPGTAFEEGLKKTIEWFESRVSEN